jgi:hypothetical protein
MEGKYAGPFHESPRRIPVMKKRKAENADEHDAQHQIGRIVLNRLTVLW